MLQEASEEIICNGTIGGQAKVLGIVLIPIAIGGLNGVLETSVVEGEVPLLLPVRMMRSLEVLLDFSNLSFTIPDLSIVVPMHAGIWSCHD